MQKRSSMDKDGVHPSLIDKLTSEVNNTAEEGLSDEVRHLIAVALGRQGGLKGGKARAKKLSAKKRSAIAKKAAQARWGNRRTK